MHSEFWLILFSAILLWVFPVFKWRKQRPQILLWNGLAQVLYGLFFIYLVEEHGQGGSSLLWLFFLGLILLLHMVAFNLWSAFSKLN